MKRLCGFFNRKLTYQRQASLLRSFFLVGIPFGNIAEVIINILIKRPIILSNILWTITFDIIIFTILLFPLIINVYHSYRKTKKIRQKLGIRKITNIVDYTDSGSTVIKTQEEKVKVEVVAIYDYKFLTKNTIYPCSDFNFQSGDGSDSSINGIWITTNTGSMFPINHIINKVELVDSLKETRLKKLKKLSKR